VEGYTYEEGNRGYLNQVKIIVYTLQGNIVSAETSTDMEGKFGCSLQGGQSYRLNFRKDVFHEYNDTIVVGGEKIFRKISMKRKPGYLFDVTLAESRTNENQVVDAIVGTRVEVYNRTTKKVEWAEEYHQTPYFQHNFEQGNHYTLMFRKQGYVDKRIEAHVNIDGCIICIEGVAELRPGVVDNLTANNTMGTLLANIDMKRSPKHKSSGMHDSIWVKTLPSLEEIVREEDIDKALQQMSAQKEVKMEEKAVVPPMQKEVKMEEKAVVPPMEKEVKLEEKEVIIEQKMMIEPATSTPARDRQLPEANNSVKLPTKVEEEDQSHSPAKFLTPLPDKFTGYSIEIGSFEVPIAENNQHFKKSGQLYYRQEADNKYYYYSGSAVSPQRIISYFETVVKPRFAEAKICLFKDGVKEYVK
jgi:hypothetical protein